MKLTGAEKLVLGANVLAMAAFCTWSLAVMFGNTPVFACCDAPKMLEMMLAAMNFPSWVAGAAASLPFAPSDPTGVLVKQLAWTLLSWRPWLAYLWLLWRVWHRPAELVIQADAFGAA